MLIGGIHPYLTQRKMPHSKIKSKPAFNQVSLCTGRLRRGLSIKFRVIKRPGLEQSGGKRLGMAVTASCQTDRLKGSEYASLHVTGKISA